VQFVGIPPFGLGDAILIFSRQPSGKRGVGCTKKGVPPGNDTFSCLARQILSLEDLSEYGGQDRPVVADIVGSSILVHVGCGSTRRGLDLSSTACQTCNRVKLVSSEQI